MLPTSVICDVMDRFGALDAEIKPVWSGASLCGLISTVWTREGDNLGIHRSLDRAQPGRVLVVAGGGQTYRALLGDLIAERARNQGIAGFVVDGSVRDVPGIRAAELPVFARGVNSAGPYKNGPYRLGEPVAVGGAVANEGDLICGDADGVVVVPRLGAEEVLLRAQRKHTQEAETRVALIAART
ncbi:methyltransferase [Leucobacter sp. M11]|uniref:RraA family protein n=1 Tax=Leucobacter sp. M11 TaxID=2993565 RepID=UPI002D80ABB2|nr:methyltransferase [Leucobacter sp. M11]